MNGGLECTQVNECAVCEYTACVFAERSERWDMVVMGNESPSFNFPALITLAFNHLIHEPYWHFWGSGLASVPSGVHNTNTNRYVYFYRFTSLSI